MLNSVILMGRLTRAPELRHTGTGKAVASFTLAVDRDFGDRQTDFIDCVAWGGTAEFTARNIGKGQRVAVSGRLQIREWTDKEGNNRRAAEVIVSNIYFADSKQSGTSEIPVTAGIDVSMEDIEDDDDLPF